MVSEVLIRRSGKRFRVRTGGAAYHRAVNSGTVRIAFNRPDCRNAFRPGTVDELLVTMSMLVSGAMWESSLSRVMGPAQRTAVGPFHLAGTSVFGGRMGTPTRE